VLPNYGFVVKDTQENASLLYSTQFFTIHQVPDQTYYPRLVVTYVYPDELYAIIAVIAIETVLFYVLLLRVRRTSNR